MKNFLCFLMITAFGVIPVYCVSTLSVVVPSELFDQEASLLVCMKNDYGDSCFRTCVLDHSLKVRPVIDIALLKSVKIESPLFERTSQKEIFYNDSLNKTIAHESLDDAIVVQFVLDPKAQVLKVLVIKPCLLDDNPFSIISMLVVAPEDTKEAQLFDEMDDLDQLLHDCDSGNFQVSTLMPSSLDMYLAYVELAVILSYQSMKRWVKNTVSTWYHMPADEPLA